MTDKRFQSVLDKLSFAHDKYKAYLKIAEDEVEKRYGISPSENDEWIDTFHISGGKMTIDELDKSMNTQ